jgi:transposase-like protein
MTRRTNEPTLALILKRRRWSVRDAEVVLSAWRESGETVTRFARHHGLVAERLLRWRRQSPGTVIQFHRVKVAAPRDEVAAEPRGIELVLRGGRRVAIDRGFDAALLEAVVRTVESWPC